MGNQHTWTNIYNMRASTAFQICTVFLTPSQIGPSLFVQISSYLDKKYNILGLPLVGATTQGGYVMDFKTELDYQLSLQHHSNNPNTHKDINKTKDIFIVAPFSRVLSYNFTNVCVKSRSPSPLQG